MKSSLSIKGIDQLVKHLDKAASLKDVQQVVKINGAQLTKTMQQNASFKGHFEGDDFVYPTGFTKRSISMWLHDGGFTAQVGPQSDYSPYLEYGTRKMAKQPFVGPSFNVQKGVFIKDLERLLK
ncbi:HK97 gp10 family phage protein [Lactococcus lactis]|uniref:HK97-gp10 family putative phage morphogenesis protein n=1 Tax=Lactococcus lactis TaxID=1358 RepID=UPI00223B129B|nr:HK97-gp10 family putative phage morphogenesis protein [Lactococcus lactis]MCT1185762.1 HK97 gp10 family phage protein [Lactococcus lactis]MCT1190164.1 HK97 gp10 family phage protein [Lactococcus lactis]